MSAQCVNCEIELNNDIMGIGVRAALYSQIILAWGMSLKYPNTFVKNSRASYMIATALLVASLIQWKTQEFSLLDALVVSFMTSMMTVFIVVSGTFREEVKPTPQPSQTTDPNSAQANTPPDDPQSANTPPATQAMQPALSDPQQAATQAPDPPALRPRRSNTQWLILFCFVNLWGGFCFNLWKDPTHFGMKGGRANCTTNGDITIWVFGVEVQAVSPGIRIAALVLISILYLVALCSLFFTLEDVLDPAIRAFRLVGGFFTTESLKRGGATLPTTSPRSLHEDPAINKIHYLLHICAFGTLLYLLVSTEMTVRKNDHAGSTMQWSYGQVIALILLLQQIMDICSTIVEGREERELQKEQEEQERRRAQRLQAGTQYQDNIPMNNLPTTPNPAAST